MGLIMGAPAAAAINDEIGLKSSSGAPGDDVGVEGCLEVTAATWKVGESSAVGKVKNGTTLVVPDVPPGDYSVSISCEISDGDSYSTSMGMASFTVTAPPRSAVFAIRSKQAHPGDTVQGRGTGYPSKCSPMVEVAGEKAQITDAGTEPGSPAVSITLPDDLLPGTVRVRLTCGRSSADTALIVLGQPTVQLDRAEGVAGATVVATGTNYPSQCQPSLKINDRTVAVTDTRPGSSPVASFVVPDGVDPGRVTVRLTCGGASAEGSFSVLPKPVPTVVVDPLKGRAGAPVTVRGSNFQPECTPEVQIGGQSVPATGQPGGGPVASFTVPPGLPPGVYTIRLTCGRVFAEVPFRVLPTPVPALALEPTTGRVGASVTARGSNFPADCRPAVKVGEQSVPVAVQSGGPVVSFTVPDVLRPGAVTIRLTCGDAFAEAPFQVQPAPVPAVVLDPISGRAATSVTARGTDFPRQCAPVVQIGAQSVPVTVQPESKPNGPVVSYTVPRGLSPGAVTVRLTCGVAFAEAPFQVLPAPVPTAVLEPGKASVGEPVTVRGTDYPADCESTVRVAGHAVSAVNRPDSQPGRPVLSFTVPNDLRPGAIPVRLDCGQATVETPLELLAVSSQILPPPPSGENPDRPAFARELPTAHEVVWTLESLAKSLVVFLGLFIIVGFPAELFNKTLEENRHRLPPWWRRDPLPEDAPGTGWWHPACYVLGSAVLLSLVEAGTGFNVQTLILAVGFLISVPLTTLAYSGSAELYLQRVERARSSFRTLPLGVVIAVLCVILSRVADFQPGYAFGLFAFFTIGAAFVPRRRPYEGASVAVGATVLLVTGVAAWVVWTPVDEVASRPDATPLVLVVDSVLATTFVLALQGVAFGLAPVEYVDGKKLWDRHKWAWAATWGSSVFLFVHVLFWKFVREWNGNVVVLIAAVAPFVLFGLISFGLWIYLRVTAAAHASSGSGR